MSLLDRREKVTELIKTAQKLGFVIIRSEEKPTTTHMEGVTGGAVIKDGGNTTIEFEAQIFEPEAI